MADQLDNRPVFTIVMGCNGAGKSAWKRDNYDRLPDQYFDQDSVAGGIGDWNSEEARERTRRIVDTEIGRAIENRKDFGIESTYSGTPGRVMVKRAKEAGYRIEGVYIGTESPEINAERIRYRVSVNTGHWVDVDRLPQRYGFSLSNLRKTAEQFDTLEIVDNSEYNTKRIPEPSEQLVLEKGVVTSRARELKPWCETWLQRFERSVESRRVEQRRDADQSGEDGVVEQTGERTVVGIGDQAENPARALGSGVGATEARASQSQSQESAPSWKDKVKSELGIDDQPADPPNPPSSAAGAAEAAQRRGQQRNGPER